MKRLIVILLFWLSGINIIAQEPTNIGAIFPYNTCASPCWLGIIPGVSTSLDVDAMLEEHSNIIAMGEYGRNISRLPNGKYGIDETTGLIQQGGYHFAVLTPLSSVSERITSRIEIREGLVDLIFVLGSEEHSIQVVDVLKNIEMPDQIHMYYSESTNDFTLYFTYLANRMRITFSQADKACYTHAIVNNFSLWGALYYSENAAYELVRAADYRDILQPRLTRFGLKNERNVPLDVWQSWLDGEVNESCYEAWEKLTPPIIDISISMQTASIIGAIYP